MAKQLLIYIIASIAVVFFSHFVHSFLITINALYTLIYAKLEPIFSHGGLNPLTRQVILLVGIPVMIAAIPALSFHLVRGKEMPYFIELTWCLWLVILLSHLLAH